MASSSAASSAAFDRVYLDYASFAPVDPRVLAVMRPFLEGGVGNPASLHSIGTEARAALEHARGKVGRLVGGCGAGVIFTAGATEANNLAITGSAGCAASGHVIATAIEHRSVLDPCRDLCRRGWPVTLLEVDATGRLDPERLREAIRPDTVLVSVGMASTEIGTIQPVPEIARITRERGILLHVDAVGAAGRVPLAVEGWGIDLLTLSSNDLCGPPGVGALWVRPEVALAPIVVGGGQEQGYRAGTENLPAIVGLGVAADLARTEGPTEAGRLAELRDCLLDGLCQRIPGARITGARGEDRLPQHASLVVPGTRADAVLLELDLLGVAASSGSSATEAPSHVLRAIGCDPDVAGGSLCFTLGRFTTMPEVERALDVVPAAVGRLRRPGS